ncbi:MAG: hypothetical protein ACW986_07610 [Promethearchaeota archaeon]|jgi:hypothetical protein
MGKDKDKDKDKKDKEKDKEKKDKDKKDKDKDKDKKDKDKEKDKDKKDKEKDKEKEKSSESQEWKLSISKTLDNYTHIYEKIANKFKDIDNYILRDANSRKDFIEKVEENVKDLPEEAQKIFEKFLKSLD